MAPPENDVTAVEPRYDTRRGMGKALVPLGVILTLLGAPRDAPALCPPLASIPAPLKSLLDHQAAIARHTAAEGRLSDSRMWELFTTGEMTLPPLVLGPSGGLAPLTVRGRWWWFPVEQPVRVEFDAGDGTVSVETSYERIEHTYGQAGQFRATVRVHDRQGRVRSHVTTITVASPGALQAEIQGRWDTFREALNLGDVGAALECMHSQARAQYRQPLEALVAGPPVPSIDQVLPSITFVEQQEGALVYEMLRTSGGRTQSFQVLFELDLDGVWRLRAF